MWLCSPAPVLGLLVVLDGGRAVDQETGHLHLAHIVEGRQPAQWTQCLEYLSCKAICSSHVMHS